MVRICILSIGRDEVRVGVTGRYDYEVRIGVKDRHKARLGVKGRYIEVMVGGNRYVGGHVGMRSGYWVTGRYEVRVQGYR